MSTTIQTFAEGTCAAAKAMTVEPPTLTRYLKDLSTYAWSYFGKTNPEKLTST